MAEKKDESHLPETNDNDEQTDKGKIESDEKTNDIKSTEDEELAKLLDSALEDFAVSENADDKNDPKESGEKSKVKLFDELNRALLELEKEEAMFDPLAAYLPLTEGQLAELIMSFESINGAGLRAGAESMTGAGRRTDSESMTGAERVTGAEASPDMELPILFPQALKQFSESPGAAEFQNRCRLSEEESKKLAEKFNKYFESPEFKKLFPFIMNMMRDLFSKEVLYGDCKSVIEKYSKWLEDNKTKLPSHEYDRHLKKLEILREVCSELEKESPDDTEEAKFERCDRIMVLMMKIQDFGPMPPELSVDMGSLFGVDRQGDTELPDFSPDECNVI